MVRLLALLALALAALFGARYFTDFSASTAETSYRLAKIDRGPIVATVNATGTINPTTTVIVGSQIVRPGGRDSRRLQFRSEGRPGGGAAQLRIRSAPARRRARRSAADARAEAGDRRPDREGQGRDRARQGDRGRRRSRRSRATRRCSADAERILATPDRIAVARLRRRGHARHRARHTATPSRPRSLGAPCSPVPRRSKTRLAADLQVAQASLVAVTAQIQQREAAVRQIEVDLQNTEIQLAGQRRGGAAQCRARRRPSPPRCRRRPCS